MKKTVSSFINIGRGTKNGTVTIYLVLQESNSRYAKGVFGIGRKQGPWEGEPQKKLSEISGNRVLFLAGGGRSFQQDHGQPLIFATFHQGKVGSTPDLEESMQWKIAKKTSLEKPHVVKVKKQKTPDSRQGFL